MRLYRVAPKKVTRQGNVVLRLSMRRQGYDPDVVFNIPHKSLSGAQQYIKFGLAPFRDQLTAVPC